jgi:short-subunit dehydrogenase
VHVPVEKVARAGLEAIERDKPLVIPGIAMKIAMAIARALPLLLLRVASGIVKDHRN